MSSTAALYTSEVLELATSLARYPLEDELTLRGAARSATCGSTIELGLICAKDGSIERLGLRAHACAIGQAAAALFAQHAAGIDQPQLSAAAAQIEAWLTGGALPTWPGFTAIAAARDYPARHGAVLLAWRAALVALAVPR